MQDLIETLQYMCKKNKIQALFTKQLTLISVACLYLKKNNKMENFGLRHNLSSKMFAWNKVRFSIVVWLVFFFIYTINHINP